jgi:hypothetical protein
LFVLIASAHAAAPVIAEGDSECALTAIAERTAVARTNLALLDIAELLAPGPPDSIPCLATRITQRDLNAELSAVGKLYDSGELTAARELAASWTTRVACVTDVVDSAWLWRAAFVTGQLAWEAGDIEGARRAWGRARSVDLGRTWDDDFTPAGQAESTFYTAHDGQSVPLTTLGGPFRVDGRPAEPKIPTGLHVIQTESPMRTWLTDVRSPFLAVHPGTDTSLLSVDEWLVLLATRLPKEEVAYLVRGDVVYQLDLSARTWQRYEAPPEIPPPPRWGRWVMAAGATVVATGLLDLLLVSRPNAMQALEDAETATGAAFDEAHQRHTAAENRGNVDYAVMGVGAAAMAVGLPNTVSTWEIEPTRTPCR